MRENKIVHIQVSFFFFSILRFLTTNSLIFCFLWKCNDVSDTMFLLENRCSYFIIIVIFANFCVFFLVAKHNGGHLPLQRGPTRDATRCTPACTSPRLHVWGKTAGERLPFSSLFSSPVVLFQKCSSFVLMLCFVSQQGNGNSCRQSATLRRESLVSLMHRRKTCRPSMYARSSGTMETWRIENSATTRESTLGKHKSVY